MQYESLSQQHQHTSHISMQTNGRIAEIKLEKNVDDFVACADKFAQDYNCTVINARSKERQSRMEQCQEKQAKLEKDLQQKQEQIASLKSTIQTQTKDMHSLEEEIAGLCPISPNFFAISSHRKLRGSLNDFPP